MSRIKALTFPVNALSFLRKNFCRTCIFAVIFCPKTVQNPFSSPVTSVYRPTYDISSALHSCISLLMAFVARYISASAYLWHL